MIPAPFKNILSYPPMHTFVAEWNGVSVLPDRRPISFEMVSDASGAWGFGAYWYPHWFHIQWSMRAQPLPIAVK